MTIACLGSVSALVAAAEPGLVLEDPVFLREPSTRIYDVRWADETSFFVAAGNQGVLHFDSSGDRIGSIYSAVERTHFTRNLAASDRWILGIGPVQNFTTHDRKSGSTTDHHRFGATDERSDSIFDILHDIDIRGGRAALLGALRGRDFYGLRGELAWSVPVENLAPVVPLLRSLAHKPLIGQAEYFVGSPNMGDCGMLGTGRIRFLDDETVLVAPGVEPNLYRVDAAHGSVLPPIWSTDDLGIDTSCRITEQEEQRLAGSVEYRQRRYLNQRRTIDEILPLPGGRFGLILRDVRQEEVHWQMVVFSVDEIAPRAHIPLPIESLSASEHLRADIRGDRIVFLVTSFVGEESTRHPRWVLARWQDSSPPPHELKAF